MSSPRIAVDARIVDRVGMELTGLGRYTVEVVRGLRAVRPDWDLVVLSNRPELFTPRLTPRKTRWPTASSLGRVTWLQAVSRLEVGRLRPDIWFGTAFAVPHWWRGPSAVTVHDLTFVTMPERYRGRLNAAYAAWTTRTSAQRSRVVFSCSNETRDALVDLLDVPFDRIAVIHHGVSAVFHDGGASCAKVTNPPYVLFVGTFEARKGLDTLAAALARLHQEGAGVRAVLAGRPGWGAEAALARLRRLGARTVISPDDEQLAQLYRGALAVVHLSRQEGFGLPVAEGMASGAAIVSTDLQCVREFACNVPLYAAVGDADAVARHLRTLREHPAERVRRATAGRRVARSLRWESAAERHAATLERALMA